MAERRLVDFGIIDIHGHYGPFAYPSLAAKSRDGLLRLLDSAGIEKIVLSSTQAISADIAAGNADVASLLESDRDERLYGQVVVNPNLARQSLDDIRRYAAHQRFVGIKYHPDYCRTPADDPKTAELFDAAYEAGFRAFFIHTWSAQQARQNLKLAEKSTDAVIFLYHMGADQYRQTLELAEPFENAVVDFSGSVGQRGKVSCAVKVLGAERVLFGSDLVLLSPFHSLGMVLEEDLPPATLRKILRDNALRLLPSLHA